MAKEIKKEYNFFLNIKDISKKPTNKNKAIQIKNNIIKKINSGRFIGMSNLDIAKEYNISPITVKKYIEEITQKIQNTEIEPIKIALKELYKNAFKTSFDILDEAVSLNEKTRAIDLQLRIAEKFQNFLYNFGLLENSKEEELNKRIEINIIDNNNNENLSSTNNNKD